MAGLLLAAPALQMVLARAQPVLPPRIAHRQLDPRHLAWVAGWAVPSVRCLERFSRPRWPALQDATRRVAGLIVLPLGMLLLVPVPLSNILPGVVLAVIAGAYLQRDGLLLCLGLVSALILFAFASAVAWSAASLTLTIWAGQAAG